ncbi:MAG: hypothetical protein FD167_949, partial [bacterium]
IAIRKKLVILLIAIFTFVGNVAMAKLFYWPIPNIQDEFSYLLTADTFAHGRLTNPIHPMWEHFESFHIMRSPTRASKFPPTQGLFIAIGQVLTGEPIIGVWLSMALACAATCWMLQAWVPPRWAMLGGILMIFNLGWFTYWSQSYWGGAVALIGGSLVFGALRRIIKKPTVGNSLWFALGLAILANSRPFEGFIASVPAVVVLFAWIIGKKSPPLKITFQKIFLPIAIVLTLVILTIGYYNYCVTGSYLVLPYQAYEAVYNNWSNFIWVKPTTKNIVYNHKEFDIFYNSWYPDSFKKNFNPSFNFYYALEKLLSLAVFFIDVPINIFLIALFWVSKNRWVRFSLLTIGLLMFAVLQVVVALTHYVAPVVCLLYFIVIQCMRYAYFWRWHNRPVGRFTVWSVPIYYCCMIFLLVANNVNPSLVLGYDPLKTNRYNKYNWSFTRKNIVNMLNQEEGKILVIVIYSPQHSMHEEWVYNEADIDNAKIVWARNMSQEKNCNLVKYFKDRKIWILTIIGGGTVKITPDVSPDSLCQ